VAVAAAVAVPPPVPPPLAEPEADPDASTASASTYVPGARTDSSYNDLELDDD
jgi:hypothetical protein